MFIHLFDFQLIIFQIYVGNISFSASFSSFLHKRAKRAGKLLLTNQLKIPSHISLEMVNIVMGDVNVLHHGNQIQMESLIFQGRYCWCSVLFVNYCVSLMVCSIQELVMIHGFTVPIIWCAYISKRWCTRMRVQNQQNCLTFHQFLFCSFISFCHFFAKIIAYNIGSYFNVKFADLWKGLLTHNPTTTIMPHQFPGTPSKLILFQWSFPKKLSQLAPVFIPTKWGFRYSNNISRQSYYELTPLWMNHLQ